MYVYFSCLIHQSSIKLYPLIMNRNLFCLLESLLEAMFYGLFSDNHAMLVELVENKTHR